MELALIFAFMASLGTTLVLGPLVIPVLRRLKVGQIIREDGPARHLSKQGTPTMGGMLIFAGMIVGTLAAGFSSPAALVVLGVAVASALLGFADDYLKVVKKRSLGLLARQKLVVQVVIGLALAWAALKLGLDTVWPIPFAGGAIDLGALYSVAVIFVFMSATNAVNETDGLDGLAAGTMVIIGLAYTLVALATGHSSLAGVALALIGGCLGFLRFNYHPARVIMGDTGSMGLGGALAALAVLTGTELLLVIVGGLLVIETLSVVLQVISFKSTGRRIFRMAPLHHHFELVGWSETQVVWRFWTVAAIFAGLGLLGLRGLGR